MRIVRFSLRKPVTITMAAAAVVIFGIIAFNRLSIDLLPDITFPTLTIRTNYPGSAPAEVENLISVPIEEAVGVVSGVVSISSISRPGLSDVVVEFNWGTRMDFASLEIREKLDRVRLPGDAEKPLLLRFDPSQAPIMRLSLTGKDDLSSLRLLAEEEVKRTLESIEGVASVTVSGGTEEEVQVEINEARLARLGIPLSQVISRLNAENVNLTGGTIKEGEAEYLVRIMGRFHSVEAIGSIVISKEDAPFIRLEDVAAIGIGIKERAVITRTNGRESVEIGIFKEAATNTVSVAGRVHERLDRLSDRAELTIIADQSRFIRESIREVIKTALLGGLLAVIILYFFIRNAGSTFIVSLAIPISVLAAFFLMFLTNVTLNIMSLGGLALGIGMLVDNSIVVLESISRHREGGSTPKEAADRGAGEVGPAVIAATLTTICVFFPVIFVQGIAGQLFFDQALTVTFSLLASLAVALTLIPMLSSLEAPTPEVTSPSGPNSAAANQGKNDIIVRIVAAPLVWLKNIIILIGKALNLLLRPLYFLFDLAMSAVTRLYPEALSWALAHQAAVIISALALFGAATPLLPFIGRELIPDVSQGEFVVEVETAGGTPVAQTDDLILALTAIATESPEVEMTYSLAGALGGSSAAEAETMESLGQLNVVLKEGLRGATEEQVMETLRSRFAELPGTAVRFSHPALFSFKAPVSLQVKGYNLELLEEIARDLASGLESISGLADISASVQGGNPEIRISFNRERLAALGLDISSLAQIIREKIQGEVASEYSSSERRVDIRVRSRIQDRASIEDLRRLTVADAGGALIPLSALAEITIARGPVEIRRQDQERTALITMNITGRDLGSAVEEIERVIADYPLPQDFTVTIGGQRQEMALSFNSMILAMILAMILVYLVMAAQFESLIQPLIIMATIPFGLIGVVLILIATGTSISVVVLIGVIMMAGIVVNNAIILVDTINQLKRAGVEPIRAVMEAARRRLRPILITTATTVLGLLPMALGFGEGSEIRSPMAVTVIGGLIFSTLLTLILIPTVYAAVDRKQIPPAEDLREGAEH